MTPEQCNQIMNSIFDLCVGDDDLSDLRDEMLRKAVRYSRIRVDWYLADPDQRREVDEVRSRSHDAFIDSCNALSRLMGKRGLDNSWRALLTNDRKVIGDFACYIHAHLGVKAR